MYTATAIEALSTSFVSLSFVRSFFVVVAAVVVVVVGGGGGATPGCVYFLQTLCACCVSCFILMLVAFQKACRCRNSSSSWADLSEKREECRQAGEAIQWLLEMD